MVRCYKALFLAQLRQYCYHKTVAILLKKMIPLDIINVVLTVKVATFISGRGSAISSAKQGQSRSIYNLVKTKLFGPCKRAYIT